MRIVVLGGMGFLGRNLVNRLVETGKHEITVFDRTIPQRDTDCPSNVSYAQGSFRSGYDFEELVSGADLVIHLVSTCRQSCIHVEWRHSIWLVVSPKQRN